MDKAETIIILGLVAGLGYMLYRGVKAVGSAVGDAATAAGGALNEHYENGDFGWDPVTKLIGYAAPADSGAESLQDAHSGAGDVLRQAYKDSQAGVSAPDLGGN